MAVSWRRVAVPAAALGVLVPAALGAHALLPSLDDSGHSAVAADAGPSAPATPDAPLDAPVDSADTGAGVAETPGNSPSAEGVSAPIRLASYDAQGHRAVLDTPKTASVRTGDVIASAPNRKAPSGALFKVAKVVRSAKGRTEVATAPASISELLGDQRVDRRTLLAPRQLRVRPLSAGVTTKGGPVQAPATPTPSPSAPAAPQRPTLRLALNVPLPKDIAATDRSPARLAGEVDFSPELIFQYERRGARDIRPERAAVGLGGTYGYGWSLHGTAPGHVDTGTVSVPLAAVTGQYTFWVGPVPVVVSAEVTFSYRFTADGRIVLDAERRTTGSFTVGARYDRAQGWQPLHEVDQRTDGGQPRIAGAATATARIGAQASVFLYGAAGVGGDLSVYLKGRASGSGDARPAWALYAGYDLSTQLTLRLRIFGIELVDLRTTPFALHDERRLCGQGNPANV
ncbi:hypothetical protein [Streptomyces silvisoli]|uniref:Uncharacterized protein n=1 Tax=Streptomyces silvisoli TaxID=3034235 RepID=A0ABT5ZL43_9ACTN|nr:hypothetical protein [Streptomyces silvisoli]MDF3290534.1 hypothetical protein [Streptomyces silvisoli]